MTSTNSASHDDKLRKQVSTLARFGGRALRSDDIGDLLQQATELVSDAIEVDLVKVLQLLPDGENMLVRAGVNWRPGVVGHATIPAGRGSAAGHALRTNESVISEDITTEMRFSIPELLIEHNVKSTVNVVIRGEAEPFGVLEVDSRQLHRFGQDDIDFLQNYANLLASAIHRVNTQRDLKESALNQKVLLHELQHRVNNMLTTIRAVARRTRAKSDNLDHFVRAFDDRLAAIARTHNLLSQPGTTILSLRNLLQQELLAQGATEGETFAERGPDVMLSSRQGQLLSMVFHELATNAVKHGALSTKDGRIEVFWQTEVFGGETKVRLTWREFGVPIKSQPIRRGYGSEVLEKSIPHMLEGAFERTFHPDGVECLVVFRPES
jgi:two-component sensor histidine kinase